jgi:hypothetical protein
MTLAIIIIVMIVFRDADTDEPITVLGLRCGFWVFLFAAGILHIYGAAMIDSPKIYDESVFTHNPAVNMNPVYVPVPMSNEAAAPLVMSNLGAPSIAAPSIAAQPSAQ